MKKKKKKIDYIWGETKIMFKNILNFCLISRVLQLMACMFLPFLPVLVLFFSLTSLLPCQLRQNFISEFILVLSCNAGKTSLIKEVGGVKGRCALHRRSKQTNKTHLNV